MGEVQPAPWEHATPQPTIPPDAPLYIRAPATFVRGAAAGFGVPQIAAVARAGTEELPGRSIIQEGPAVLADPTWWTETAGEFIGWGLGPGKVAGGITAALRAKAPPTLAQLAAMKGIGPKLKAMAAGFPQRASGDMAVMGTINAAERAADENATAVDVVGAFGEGAATGLLFRAGFETLRLPAARLKYSGAVARIGDWLGPRRLDALTRDFAAATRRMVDRNHPPGEAGKREWLALAYLVQKRAARTAARIETRALVPGSRVLGDAASPRRAEAARVLALSPMATESEAHTAFRRLAMKYHPDVNPEPGALEKFKAIAEAYDILVSRPRSLIPRFDLGSVRGQAESDVARVMDAVQRGVPIPQEIFKRYARESIPQNIPISIPGETPPAAVSPPGAVQPTKAVEPTGTQGGGPAQGAPLAAPGGTATRAAAAPVSARPGETALQAGREALPPPPTAPRTAGDEGTVAELARIRQEIETKRLPATINGTQMDDQGVPRFTWVTPTEGRASSFAVRAGQSVEVALRRKMAEMKAPPKRTGGQAAPPPPARQEIGQGRAVRPLDATVRGRTPGGAAAAPGSRMLDALTPQERDELPILADSIRRTFHFEGPLSLDAHAQLARYGSILFRGGYRKYGPWAREMIRALGRAVKRFLWKVWARVKSLHREQEGMAGRQPEPGSPRKFFQIARAAGLSKPERTRLWEAVREAHPSATPEGLAFIADAPPAKVARALEAWRTHLETWKLAEREREAGRTGATHLVSAEPGTRSAEPAGETTAAAKRQAIREELEAEWTAAEAKREAAATEGIQEAPPAPASPPAPPAKAAAPPATSQIQESVKIPPGPPKKPAEAPRAAPPKATGGQALYIRDDPGPFGDLPVWKLEGGPRAGEEVTALPSQIEDMGYEIIGGRLTDNAKPGARSAELKTETPVTALTADETRVLEFLTADPTSMDTVIQKSGLPAHKVSGALTMLELKGRVRPLAGSNFVRVEGAGTAGPEAPTYVLEGKRVRRLLEDAKPAGLVRAAKVMRLGDEEGVHSALWRLSIRSRARADFEGAGRKMVPEQHEAYTPLLEWLRGTRINAWRGAPEEAEMAQAVAGRAGLRKFFDFKTPRKGAKPTGGYIDQVVEDARADPESGFKGDTTSELLDAMTREADLLEEGGKKSLADLLDAGDEKARAMAQSIRGAIADEDEARKAVVDAIMPHVTSGRTGISEAELRRAVRGAEVRATMAEAEATEAKVQAAKAYAAKEKIIVLLDQFLSRKIDQEELQKGVIDTANAVLPPEKRYKVLTGALAKPMTEKRVAGILERIDDVRREAHRGGLVEEAGKVLSEARKVLPKMSPEYQPLLAEILDQVQRTGLTRDTVADLLRRRKYLDMHPEIEELMPERLRKELDRLGQKPLTEMSPEELRIFTDTVGRLIRQDKLAREVRIGQRDEDKAKAIAASMASIKDAADDRPLLARSGREPEMEGKVFGIDFPPYRWLKQYLRRAANVKTQIMAWTYGEGPLTQLLVKDVQEAARVEAYELGEASDAAMAAVRALPGLGEGKLGKKDLEARTRIFERRPLFGAPRTFHQATEAVEVPGGPTLHLTVGQQVQLLLHLRDPYVVEELAKRAGDDMQGGIHLRPAWNPSEIIETIRIGEVPAIRAALEARVGKSADILGAYYNGPFRDRLFAKQFELDGYRVPTRPDYGGPIYWEREITMAATPLAEMDAAKAALVDTTHQGFFKERKGGRRDLLIGDAFDVFLRHTTVGGQIIARGTVLDAMNQVVRDGALRETLIKYRGRSAQTALDDYLRSMMVNRRTKVGPETGIMQALTQGTQISQLGINPWTWLRQLPATILFPTSDAIDGKVWARVLLDFAGNPAEARAASQRMIEHSAWARKRYQMQGGHSLVNQALEGGNVGPRALRDQVMQPISWFDQAASTPAWRTAEIMEDAANPGLRTSDPAIFWDQVDRRFVEAMNDTQQSSDPHVKSGFAREAMEQKWMKLFLAYQSQPTADLNNLARKHIALRIAVKSGDPAKIAQARKNLYVDWALIVTAGVLVMVIVNAAQRWARSGGKDKPSAESLALSTLNNVTGNLPFLREPLGAMQQAVLAGRVPQGAGQTPLLSQLANFYDVTAHVGQAIHAAEKGRPLSPALGKGLEHAFFGTAGIVGLPTAPYRDVKGLYRFAAGHGVPRSPGQGRAAGAGGRRRPRTLREMFAQRRHAGTKARRQGRHAAARKRPRTIREWFAEAKAKRHKEYLST